MLSVSSSYRSSSSSSSSVCACSHRNSRSIGSLVLFICTLMVINPHVNALEEQARYQMSGMRNDDSLVQIPLPLSSSSSSSSLPNDFVSNLLKQIEEEVARGEGAVVGVEEEEKVVPNKRVYSSPSELIQAERPSGSLANFMGTLFPSVSYPVEDENENADSIPSLISSANGLALNVRRKRSTSASSSSKINRLSSQPLENVCESIDQWVSKDETKDWLGNTVRVLRKIDFNGTKVNQYFHEIVCRRNAGSSSTGDLLDTRPSGKSYSECHGIDKSKWRSECREDYVWTYAKVESMDGEIGWVWIPVSGSCSCGIRPKEQSEQSTTSRRKEYLFQKYCSRYSPQQQQQQSMRTKDKLNRKTIFS